MSRPVYLCTKVKAACLHFFPVTILLLCYVYFSCSLFCFRFCLFSVIVVAILSERMARLLKRQGAFPMDEHEEMDSPSPSSDSTVPTPAIRPNHLLIANPLRPAEPQPVTSSPTCGVEDGVMTEAHDGIGNLMAAVSGISPG
jgi:hypothetical protein